MYIIVRFSTCIVHILLQCTGTSVLHVHLHVLYMHKLCTCTVQVLALQELIKSESAQKLAEQERACKLEQGLSHTHPTVHVHVHVCMHFITFNRNSQTITIIMEMCLLKFIQKHQILYM